MGGNTGRISQTDSEHRPQQAHCGLKRTQPLLIIGKQATFLTNLSVLAMALQTA